jgi:hypothetical protein
MEETIQYILKKLIKPRLEQLKETTISGIDTMEKYQYIVGQYRSLNDLQQDLRTCLRNRSYLMTIQTNEEIPAKKMGLLDAYATEDEIKKNTKLFLDPTKIDLSLKERIPTPTGWRVLVMPWAGPEKQMAVLF